MNIKRPIKIFLISIILGIILSSGIMLIDKLIVLSVSIFLLLILFLNKNINIKILLLIFLFVFFGFFRFKIEKIFYDKINFNIEALNNKKQEIIGVISSKGRSTNSNYFILEKVKIFDINFYKMRCYYDEEKVIDAKIGNIIKINGYIYKNLPAMNIGQFDSELYYRSLGETGTIYANNIEIVNTDYNIIKQKIYECKQIIINQIFKIFNKKNAGLFTAMLSGDKSYLDIEQKNLFNENGIAHILAISGLHLSILGLCLFELFRKKLSINVSAILVSIFILLYAIFIDASATSMRAIIMLFVRFLSLSIGRSYDSNNTLFLTALFFVIYRPYLIFNSGFQFSYIAVFSLNIKYRIKSKKIYKLKKYFYYKYLKKEIKNIDWTFNIPQIVVLTLFLLPITIYNYFSYPLYSILINMIVIPLMTFVLIFSIFGLFASFVNLLLGRFLVGMVHYIFIFYELLCHFFEQLPFHTIKTIRPKLSFVIVYYLLLIFLYFIFDLFYRFNNNSYINFKNTIFIKLFNKLKKIFIYINCKALLIFSFFSILISILLMNFHYINGINIEMLYIGQGDSLIIRSNDIVMTVDGGSTTSLSNGKYILEPNLKAKGISKIDIAFISHSDIDHTNCIEYLLNESDIIIETAVLPIFALNDIHYDKFKNLCINKGVDIIYLSQFDKMVINNDLTILCLSPSKDYIEAINNINEQSLCFRLEYQNRTVLFTGDIGNVIEEKLCNNPKLHNLLKCDILKVAHHGSKNSSSDNFLNLTFAKYSIVSYGINNKYGHPNEETLTRLSKYNIYNYKTGDNGEIDINISNNNIKIETFY